MRVGARNIYALAAGTGAVNAELIAWGVLVMLFVDGLCVIVFGGAPRIVMNFLFSAILIHAAMRTMLSGGAVTGLPAALKADGKMPWSFVFRVFMLSVPGVLAIMTVGGLLLPVMGQAAALFAAVVAGLAVQAGTFALFGAMLTDLARGGEGEATAALERGQGQFGAVFRLMLIGPVATEIAVFAVGRALDAMGLADRVVEQGAAHINVVGLVVDGTLLAGSAAVAMLTAAVLVVAWRDKPA